MSIDSVIFQRNARIRGHRATGLPVVGGWSKRRCQCGEPGCDEVSGWVLDFTLRCLVCPDASIDASYGYEFFDSGEFDIPRAEADSLGYMVRDDGCPHVTPLLEVDSEEVRAAYELELLAGGAQ